MRNAQEFERAGAARLIPEPQLSPERLTQEIFSLLDQPARLAELAARAKSLARPDAVRDIVEFDRAGGTTMMITFHKFQRIHMVGIGGIGMSGIAEVLLTLGYAVSGSDAKSSAITERLQNLGAEIHEGHRAENVAGRARRRRQLRDSPRQSRIARSRAPENSRHPSRRNARRTDAPEIRHRGRRRARQDHHDFDDRRPSSLPPDSIPHSSSAAASITVGATARLGRGDYMVVEADESDRSFLLLAPVVAVVTTIDREHLDHYASLEEIQDAFTQFVNRVPFYGAVILCLDEPNVQAILPRVQRPVITYGTSSQADLVICRCRNSSASKAISGSPIAATISAVFHLNGPPGIHNVRNAAAAAAVALHLDVPADLIREGLENFTGVGRRFEIKGVIRASR